MVYRNSLSSRLLVAMTIPRYFWDNGSYFAGKLSGNITTTQVNSALHPSGVAKSSTSFGWGKDGKVPSAGRQVTLCDTVWHVISCSSVMISTNCYIQWLEPCDRPCWQCWLTGQWWVDSCWGWDDVMTYNVTSLSSHRRHTTTSQILLLLLLLLQQWHLLTTKRCVIEKCSAGTN